MKRFFFIISSILLLSFPLLTPVIAQDSSDSNGQMIEKVAPRPPVGDMPPQLFGQNHWYSVVFRGNSEAVVSTRITFTNTGKANRTGLVLRVPKVEPKDIFVFQVIREGRCLLYDKSESYIGRPASSMPCIQYEDPDINGWYGPSKYQRATAVYSGDTLTITIPQPVKPEKSGDIILFYRAFGYAKKNLFGAHQFSFETLKSEDTVSQLNVGISTDSDLTLRGAKSQVNYRFEEPQTAMKGMADMSSPIANSRMDSYYQQIGGGQIVKSASNLQALESYTVRGSYADSLLRLYTREIGIGVAIIIAAIVLIICMIRFMYKKTQVSKPTQTAPDSNLSVNAFIALFGASFLSAICIIGYTIILVIIMRALSSYTIDYDMQLPVTIVLLVISVGVYGFLLFAPALFLGFRFGIGMGFGTAGLTMGWLVIALVLYLIISMGVRNSYQMPMEIMKSYNGSAENPERQVESVELQSPK